MKKLILLCVTLMCAFQAKALTADDCARMTTKEIANQLIHAISLGATSGQGNDQCMKEAESLNVEISSEEGDGSNQPHLLATGDRVQLIGITKLDLSENLATYEIIKSNGARAKGTFKFFDFTGVLDPSSLDSVKCSGVSSDPTINFMQARCR